MVSLCGHWRKKTKDGGVARLRTSLDRGADFHPVVRYEYKPQIYSAFFHLACIMIVLNRL